MSQQRELHLTAANLQAIQRAENEYQGALPINSRYNCSMCCTKSGTPTYRLSLTTFIVHVLEDHCDDEECAVIARVALGMYPPLILKKRGSQRGTSIYSGSRRGSSVRSESVCSDASSRKSAKKKKDSKKSSSKSSKKDVKKRIPDTVREESSESSEASESSGGTQDESSDASESSESGSDPVTDVDNIGEDLGAMAVEGAPKKGRGRPRKN